MSSGYRSNTFRVCRKRAVQVCRYVVSLRQGRNELVVCMYVHPDRGNIEHVIFPTHIDHACQPWMIKLSQQCLS